MTPEYKFILFAIFGAASLLAGWGMRQRQVVSEDASRPIHFWTLILLWAPISLWAFWSIKIDFTLATLMLVQPLAMIGGGLAALMVCRLLKLRGPTSGVLIIAAACSNQGFTLGGYLCYALLNPPDMAIGYAMAFVTAMQVCMVLIYYPVAAHFSHEPTETVVKLMVSSFITMRAIPLYAAAVGAMLSLSGLRVPTWISGLYLPDIFFFLGALGSYLGIGLRLRVGDTFGHARMHGGLVLIKFIILPLITIGVAYAYVALGAPLVDLPNGIGDLPLQVIMISSCTPAAINTVIICNLFHLDARLASNLWVVNTILFFVIPLPVILYFFG